MKKILVISGMLFSLMLLFSCSDENPANNNYPPPVIGPPNNGLNMDSIVSVYASQIDTTKIVGEMTITDYNRSLLNYNFTTNSSRFCRLNLSSLDADLVASFPFGECSVNGVSASRVSDGDVYVYTTYGGDGYSQYGLNLNFDGTNDFDISSNSYFSGVDTTISFFDETGIISHEQGDTISTASDFYLSWTNETDYARVEFTSVPNPDSSGAYTGVCFLENEGSYTFPSSQMSDFPEGVYTITVSNFEPYFLKDSQGRLIVAIVESKRSIGVYFGD